LAIVHLCHLLKLEHEGLYSLWKYHTSTIWINQFFTEKGKQMVKKMKILIFITMCERFLLEPNSNMIIDHWSTNWKSQIVN
jgi:hypothetical protein